ncbi:MAG: hypothetical protein IJG42_04880 [Muribaculaceae bacterium]|nr:hypothetical protein [Muribaculaceae bacterium]
MSKGANYILGLCMFFFLGLPVFAQSQEGYVRTEKGTALSGVTLRPIGNRNTVTSDQRGHFVMELGGNFKEGDSFRFSYVHKNGYEPLDKGLLDRQFVVSSSVPVEIVLISSKHLIKTKEKVERQARKNAEREYNKQLKNLRKQLDNQKISINDYYTEKRRLDWQMASFETLIAAMAEHYARTDYEHLDSLNAAINDCIIKGELEKADSLINTKGDVINRAYENIEKGKRLHEAEVLLDSIGSVINGELDCIRKKGEQE